ncbi:hypothetical protein ACFL5P_02860 [candidate division KSB1 bacterium]
MSKAKIITIVVLSFIFSMCAATGVVVLTEPEEGMNLIIGNVAIELRDYQSRREVYYDKINVAIIGSYMENGEEKMFFDWTVSDEEGFYYFPNVPTGKYEVKGIWSFLKGGDLFNAAKPYRDYREEFTNTPRDQIVASGILFNNEPVNRIVNLKYKILEVFTTGELRSTELYIIQDRRLPDQTLLNKPLIYNYFIEHPDFEESGWLEFLKKEAAKWGN